MRHLLPCAVLLLVTACNRGGREARQAPQPAGRDCQCPCPADASGGSAAAPIAGAPGALLGPGQVDAQGLYASASRKMNHGDGPGCLQDLDNLLVSDPRMTHQQAMLRGQCEMLSGRCQEGKQRIDGWFAYQLNTPAEQRLRTVEALAAMYCRGGNMTDRDRLLAAHHQLTQGAYVSQISSAECQAAYHTARSLAPKVPPRSAEDTPVSALPRSLFHTAASCFARAGDCSAARRAFDESYPEDSLASIKDPKVRQNVLDSSFKSTVPRCSP